MNKNKRWRDWTAGVVLAAAALSCGREEPTTAGPAAPSVGWQQEEVIAQAGAVAEDLYLGLYPPAVSLSIDAAGRGWAVWTRFEPPRVESARLDGDWKSPTIVRDCTEAIEGLPGRRCTAPTVVLNEAGRVITGWVEGHADWVCMASEWRAGAWTPAVRVQSEPTGSAATRGRGLGWPRGPFLSLDAVGHAWMFWWRRPESRYPDTPPETLMASYSPRAGEWSVEAVLERDALYGSAGPAPAALADGERLVTWGLSAGIESALISPTRRWQRSEVARTDDGTYVGSAATLPAGDVLVAWAVRSFELQRPSDLSVTRLTPDLQVAETVAVAEDGLQAPQLTLSSAGTVFIVWPTSGGVAARSTPRWGDPLGPVKVIGTGPASGVQLAASAPDAAVAVWTDGDLASGFRVAAAHFRPSQGWSAIATLHQGRPSEWLGPPQLAVDKSGNAVVVFSSTSFPAKDVAIHSVRYREQ